MNRIALMVTLSLVASLASCAPRLTGPAGEDYTPDTRIGSLIYFVPRVPLAELSDQTPDTTFVSFPDCQGGVVSVRDVRRLGAPQAAQVCRNTVARGAGGILGAVLLGAAVFAAVLLYVLNQLKSGAVLLIPLLQGLP